MKKVQGITKHAHLREERIRGGKGGHGVFILTKLAHTTEKSPDSEESQGVP